MAVYIVAQLKFTRRELYDRYQSRFMGVFRKFKGKLFVADEHPVVLEGEWPRDKMIPADEVASAVAYALARPPDVLLENITLGNLSGAI